ncbi:MAG: protein of Unknown Function containing DUF928 domain [Phormidium sp. OSCR]|nr:MAG: protein of Unknown Function containing DUF928 domain [Phormidium sp. OSCR]
MAMVCHPVSSLTLSLGLLLGLLSSPLTPVKAQFPTPSQETPLNSQGRAVQFSPPDRGAPDSTEGGATRRSDCIHVVPLMPTDDEQAYFGLTYQEHPSLYWYIGSAKAGLETAEIIIERDNNSGDIEEVHRVTVPLPPNLNEQEHILRFSPSPDEPGLEVGQTYRWYLEVQCNLQDRQDPTTLAIYDGWIERVDPDPEQTVELENTNNAQDLAYLYGSAGIWFDYLDVMVNRLDAWPDILTDLDLIAADTQIEIASPGDGPRTSMEMPQIQFFSFNRDRSSGDNIPEEVDDAGELQF